MSLLYIKLCSKLHCCGKFIVFLTFFSWNLLCNIRRHSKEKKEEKNKRKKESIHFIHGTFIKIFINYGMTAINQSPFIFYQIINREEEGGVMVSNCIITIHIHIYYLYIFWSFPNLKLTACISAYPGPFQTYIKDIWSIPNLKLTATCRQTCREVLSAAFCSQKHTE